MGVYYRVTCAERGICNTEGVGGKCSKCGQQRTGGAYWYRFRFAGRIIHESAKTQRKTVAREAEQQRRHGLEETWNQIPDRRKMPPTFGAAAEKWLAERELQVAGGNLSPGTLKIDHQTLKHLTPVFGQTLLCDITPTAIAIYKRHG